MTRRRDISLPSGSSASVDWRRLGAHALILGPVPLAALGMLWLVQSGGFAADFRGGAWRAAGFMLAGRSPYGHADVATLLAHPHAFVTPPFLGLIVVPLSPLPFGVASLVWSSVSVAAFTAALYLVGARSWHVYAIALLSFPFIMSLANGQPDGLVALAAAVAWRFRESWIGAAAVGLLIGAKLLAWPLIIWLIVTRRLRSGVLAAVWAVAVTVASWSAIHFHGLTAYPRLLAADARAWQAHTYSFVAAFMHAGFSAGPSKILAVALAVTVAAATIRRTEWSDLAWFAAALTMGLLVSPMLRISYLVVLFIPLAIVRPSADGLWILTGALWLAVPGLLPLGLQVTLVLTICAAVTIGLEPRRSPSGSSRGVPLAVQQTRRAS